MGVTCQILIRKCREGVYKPGDPVKGVVKYKVDEPIEFKDVKLSFLGKGECRWSDGDDYYTGSEYFIQTHVNVTNKKPDETVTLHGVYEHRFKFFLPKENIPSTFKDKIGSIIYYVQLKFTTKLFSFNKVFTAQIPVYGTVDLLNPDGTPFSEGPTIFGLEKSVTTLIPMKKSVISLKAEIAKTRLTPGENVHLFCTVVNSSNVEITGVKAELYCYTTYTSDSGKILNSSKTKYCEVEMPGFPARKNRNYTCILPTLPECYSILYSKVICKKYKVRVTVRLPAPHANASAEIPVAIGELKDLNPRFVEAEFHPLTYFETMVEETDEDPGEDWDVFKKMP